MNTQRQTYLETVTYILRHTHIGRDTHPEIKADTNIENETHRAT